MENSAVTLLKNFEDSSKWFHQNLNLLREKGFSGKFVAIKGKKVIASGKKLDSLINKLEKNGETPTHLFIEFVYPEGFVLIL